MALILQIHVLYVGLNVPDELETMYFPFALNSAPSTNDVWPISDAACKGWDLLEIVEPVGIGMF